MMRNEFLSWLVVGSLAATPAIASVQAPPPQSRPVSGIWINPKGTVKVATGNCAGKLCGWVVWASPTARADAAAAGVKQLIGTELLRDYRMTGTGHWQGKVYVPDMGRTFYSTLTQTDPHRLKIRGCIVGGMVCKSQIWTKSTAS